MSDDGVRRLHVTPLNPTLLNAILNPSVRSLATDVSFHSVQTFPENSYGFLTLPTAEADKLMKKLNGSILKGKNLNIQEATTKRGFSEQGYRSDMPPQMENRPKKPKESGDAIRGFELPVSRRVKRGWTEEPVKDKKARKADKSDAKADSKKRRAHQAKYTDSQECLFRTVAPSNKRDIGERSEKRCDKKNAKRAEEAVLIHEFKNTVPQPTFIRAGDDASEMNATSEFVEGKGWIDRGGNVKEPSTIKPSKRRSDFSGKPAIAHNKSVTKDGAHTEEEQVSVAGNSEETSSSGSSIESSSEEDMDEEESTLNSGNDGGSLAGGPSAHKTVAGNSSSSPTGESSEEDEMEKEKNTNQLPAETSATAKDTAHPSTPKTNSGRGNTQTDMHHLTTLFRPPSASSSATSKPMLEVNTQFNFFGGINDDDDIDGDAGEDGEKDENNDNVRQEEDPQTPFTKLDLHDRNLRSGAPTPDTAAADRTRFWEEDTDDDNDNDNGASPRPAAVKQGNKEESDFAKWFWENRGDNNRAWKRRRREAAKEKRQKENRKQGGVRGK